MIKKFKKIALNKFQMNKLRGGDDIGVGKSQSTENK